MNERRNWRNGYAAKAAVHVLMVCGVSLHLELLMPVCYFFENKGNFTLCLFVPLG